MKIYGTPFNRNRESDKYARAKTNNFRDSCPTSLREAMNAILARFRLTAVAKMENFASGKSYLIIRPGIIRNHEIIKIV